MTGAIVEIWFGDYRRLLFMFVMSRQSIAGICTVKLRTTYYCSSSNHRGVLGCIFSVMLVLLVKLECGWACLALHTQQLWMYLYTVCRNYTKTSSLFEVRCAPSSLAGPFRTIRTALFANEKVELCESRIMTPVNTHTSPNLFWKKVELCKSRITDIRIIRNGPVAA